MWSFALRIGLLASLMAMNFGIVSKLVGSKRNSEKLSIIAKDALTGGLVLILLVGVATMWYNV